MGKHCCKECLARAKRDLVEAHKYNLQVDVLSGYRRYRKSGDCPCRAMWAACYDWDI
jgi:hypothetical protein